MSTIISDWRERRRQKRLERAELRLADAEHHLRKWGFANTPSQDDYERKQIDKLRARVEALRGN